jgi:hypothetical protein
MCSPVVADPNVSLALATRPSTRPGPWTYCPIDDLDFIALQMRSGHGAWGGEARDRRRRRQNAVIGCREHQQNRSDQTRRIVRYDPNSGTKNLAGDPG